MPRPRLDVLALLALAVLPACSGGPTGVISVTIGGGDRVTQPGKQTVLTAFVDAADGLPTGVTWSSSDASVATIDAGGLLTALSQGATTVTATSVSDTDASDSVNVTVAPDPEAPQHAAASYIASAGSGPVLAVALYFQDPSTLITTLALAEPRPGLYLGPVSPVGADGAVQLVLPDPDELPAAIMETAADFVLDVTPIAGCSLVASEPTVPVTYMTLNPFSNPGVAAISGDGADPILMIDTALDPDSATEDDLNAAGRLAFVYAASAVAVHSEGSGCEAPGHTVSVEVDLRSGWNLLELRAVFDTEDPTAIVGATLRNSDDEIHLLRAPGA